MPTYRQLIYCSHRATRDDAAATAEIRDILSVSREGNSRNSITGALLFTTGYFAQVLEGAADAVERLFENIRVDGRHHDVVLLASMSVSGRAFPDWSMGFTSPDDADANATAETVIAQALSLPGEAAAVTVRELIQSSIAKLQLW